MELIFCILANRVRQVFRFSLAEQSLKKGETIGRTATAPDPIDAAAKSDNSLRARDAGIQQHSGQKAETSGLFPNGTPVTHSTERATLRFLHVRYRCGQ